VEGFRNVKVIKGGVEAWKVAGYPMARSGRADVARDLNPGI
jgi:3-mercaptopyruvate sulfurtransferase SseA